MAENTNAIREELRRRVIAQGHRGPEIEEYIKPRGIHPQRVEEVIRSARKVKNKVHRRWEYKKRGLTVITDEWGSVITVWKNI